MLPHWLSTAYPNLPGVFAVCYETTEIAWQCSARSVPTNRNARISDQAASFIVSNSRMCQPSRLSWQSWTLASQRYSHRPQGCLT